MKKLLPSILLIGALILAMSGCTARQHKYVIGVSQCSRDSWREKLNEELRTAEYLNDSIEVRLASADDDNAVQMRQIDDFVKDGVDLLIVSPNQMDNISPAIDRAYDKGIPVILFDRKTKSGKYTAFIGGDNVVAGKALARFIAQRLGGRGRIVEIRGSDGSSAAVERHEGFMEILREYPGITVVASEEGDWKEPSGGRAMRRILAGTRDFDFVFAHNDRMGLGAYREAVRAGLAGRYAYVGVDGMATPDGGLELVRRGIFAATYVYPTHGDGMIKLAKRILAHQPFRRDNLLQTSIVTRDNVGLSLLEARDAERQLKNVQTLHGQVDRYVATYHSQRMALWLLLLLITVGVVAIVLVYRGYMAKARLSEQLARKNDELNRLNGEVMQLTHSRLVFFTNISHELRTPLTLIADPVEMLLEDTHIKGRSRELLRTVRRNALALQQLVDSILDFRKVQNGKMSLRLTRFDAVKALAAWTDGFRITAERRHIRLHLDVSGFTGDVMVVADKEKVARIVYNLLTNALKYTPRGGDIYVSLRDADPAADVPASSSSAQSGTMMRIDVRDTGRGISADETARVFERFFQTRGTAGGTGIGLALVKSFAELHHGTVRVESQKDKGADFIVLLPRQQETDGERVSDEPATEESREEQPQYIDDSDAAPRALQQAVSVQTDRPTILIVDDNDDIRQYERMLLKDDYTVLEASDGKEGLETARREVPDLIVCDVMMPVMDGMALTERLKTDTATSHIPVIMLTARHLEEQRAEGYEHGADSYITKPFHSKVLLARIHNLLRQRQQLRRLFQGTAVAETEIGESKLEDRDKQFVRQLNAIIQKHLSDSSLSVEDIGRQIGLSRVQLYRKVKALTGLTVVDLIRKARLVKARRLLETHSMSVSEVAYEVGFSAPSYFTKCFKEEYGMLPGDLTAPHAGNSQ